MNDTANDPFFFLLKVAETHDVCPSMVLVFLELRAHGELTEEQAMKSAGRLRLSSPAQFELLLDLLAHGELTEAQVAESAKRVRAKMTPEEVEQAKRNLANLAKPPTDLPGASALLHN